MSKHRPSRDHLDRSVFLGLAWTGAAKWSAQILSWISTVIVARLLSPSDYGIVAIATASLGFIALVNEFGLGSAIVTLRDLQDDQIAQLNTFAVMMGGTALLLVCSAAVPLGVFYQTPELPWVIGVMGVGLFIAGFRSVPNALLEKEMQFKVVALLEGGQAVAVAMTTVALALLGFGYWELVVGNLTGIAANTLGTLLIKPYRFLFPTMKSLSRVLTFSWHMMTSRVAFYLATTADVFIAGRVLGQAAVGAYSFGSTIASLPIDKITSLFARVLPSLYSAAQEDLPGLRRYLLGLTESVALITFPVGFGLAAVADKAIPLLLGNKWNAAIAPLQILACWAAVRSLAALFNPLLYVLGYSRFAMWNGVAALFEFPIAFYIGCQWGATGLAVAWIIAYPFNQLPTFLCSTRAIGLSTSTYVRALYPALSSTFVMILAVWTIKNVLPTDLTTFLRLCLEISGGVTAYTAALWGIHRERTRVIFQFLRAVRRRPTSEPVYSA